MALVQVPPRGCSDDEPSDTIQVMVNVNDGIHAPTVRAVFPDGSAEVMPTATAVRKAQAMGLDLVLVAPSAIPPVAKAMDYGQWLEESKGKQRDED